MHKRWLLRSCSALEMNTVPEGTHPVVAAILAARGISAPEDARRFLSPLLAEMPDPFLLKGVGEAVGRLIQAHRKGEHVCVHGDYDVDGVTSTALMVAFLRQTGFNCSYFIPNRFEEGYGLCGETIVKLQESGISLLVAVDCGITAVEEAEVCRRLDLDLIVLDHHAPGERIPAACAIVNALQPGCVYPYKHLAGVGVVFNLLICLRSEMLRQGLLTPDNRPDLKEWLDLVALGTIADVVPLTDQNRVYVSHGLRLLSDSKRPGLEALKKVSGITGSVSCGQVGFRLAPRLNAAGRMDSAAPGVELLLGTDRQECFRIAELMDAANTERQMQERSIFEEAVDMIERSGIHPNCRSIVLESQHWHEGVIGIVASRLAERYHRPCILFVPGREGTAKGSGRSIADFHLLDGLKSCSEHLVRYGGHRYAAGVTLQSDKIGIFREVFERHAASVLDEKALCPQLWIDYEASPEQVDAELAIVLRKLEPFGQGNPEPVLMMKALSVLETRRVGEGHLRLHLAAGSRIFEGIAFRMADRTVPECMDIAFFPELNHWNGSSRLQLRIKDWRPAAE